MKGATRFKRKAKIFDAACDLPSDQREAFLVGACEGDSELRSEIEALLEHDDSGARAIDAAAEAGGAKALIRQAESFTSTDPPNASLVGHLGNYLIVHKLGHGGMGEVFEAEQESPKRRVALKVIRAGHLSPNLIKRFEREAFVLGQLQHPGIAHIYESGMVDVDGHQQPFFAMELISGERITTHVRSHGFAARQRLELMARVCDAVQHAHQKGIIHRDLKPANILVVEQGTGTGTRDGTTGINTTIDVIGQPKILDFGVARITEGDVQATTMQTDIGQMIGTLAYMSPEQVLGDSSKLDTRCDVYALGVLLFELLTDRLPLDITDKSVAEAARIIRDEEPTVAGSIDRTFRGDVETIIAKALEKDPDRRYASAAELASDIRRYIQDEPITARPASTFYQAKKFARRHTGLVAGLALTFLMMVIALGGTTYGVVNAQRAQLQAQRAQQIAEQRRQQVEAVAGFQASMLQTLDPRILGRQIISGLRAEIESELKRNRTNENRIADYLSDYDRAVLIANPTNVALDTLDSGILMRAHEATEESFTDQPVIRARLFYSLGVTYAKLGFPSKAEFVLQRSLDLFGEHLSHDDSENIAAMNALAGALSAEHPEKGLELIRKIVAVTTQLHGPSHEATLDARVREGRMLRDIGHLAEAEHILSDVLARTASTVGQNHPTSVDAIDILGGILSRKGKNEEAERHFRLVLEICTKTFPGSERLTRAHNNLGNILRALGRHKEAENHLREAHRILREIKGDDHPDVLITFSNLGGYLASLRRLEEALGVFEQVLVTQRRVLGENHPDTLRTLTNIGGMHFELDRKTKAMEFIRSAYTGRKAMFGDSHPETLRSTYTLGVALIHMGRFAEAEVTLKDGLSIADKSLPNGHPTTEAMVAELASCLRRQQKWDEAEGYSRRLVVRERAKSPVRVSILASRLFSHGRVLLALNRLDEAEAVVTEAQELLNADGKNGSFDWHWTNSILGAVLINRHRYKDAERVLCQSYASLVEHAAKYPSPRRAFPVNWTRDQIIKLYDVWGNAAKAEHWRAIPDHIE